MRRTEVPDAMLKTRRADIDKIPHRTLAKLTRADLANRLLAAGEYRRRADPRLDADLFAYRLGLAREVLVTDDPKRAAELVKGARVGTAPPRPAAAPPRKAPAPAAGVRSVYVHTPTLDMLGTSKSLSEGMTKLIGLGALGDLRRDIAAVEKARADMTGGKSAEYERKAYTVSDPQLRRGYLDLARAEREKAAR